MKAWKFLGAPLMLMLLSGMPWSNAFAEDTTEPVVATSGEHKTVDGNVTVQDSPRAVSVSTENPTEGDLPEDKSASVDVKGNVTLTNSEGSGRGVYARSWNGDVSVTVDGDISASSTGETTGIFEEKYTYSSNVNVNVNGNISAKSEEGLAGGINQHGGNLQVKGNVTAEGKTKQGMGFMVMAQDEDTSTNIEGNVSAQGQTAYGALLMSDADVDPSVEAKNITTKIDGNVTATGIANNGSPIAYGLAVANFREAGVHDLDVGGDVVAKAPSGRATGIETSTIAILGRPFADPETADKRKTIIRVHGNLVSDNVGISRDILAGQGDYDILVENTIDAKEVGILFNKIPEDSTTDPRLNLTVWKIKPNENKNVAEIAETPQTGNSSDGTTRTAATDFEKKIMYIIKVEQPGEGATIKAVDANGNALEKSFGFDVAHEGDMVVLKATVEDGYKIVAAYNGDGERALLSKNSNGDYFIVVPKGGGVYLTVEVEDATEHSYSDPDDNKETITDDVEESKEDSKSGETSASKSSYSKAVKTGDEKQVAPWLILSVVGIGGIAGLDTLSKNRVKKAEEK